MSSDSALTPEVGLRVLAGIMTTFQYKDNPSSAEMCAAFLFKALGLVDAKISDIPLAATIVERMGNNMTFVSHLAASPYAVFFLAKLLYGTYEASQSSLFVVLAASFVQLPHFHKWIRETNDATTMRGLLGQASKYLEVNLPDHLMDPSVVRTLPQFRTEMNRFSPPLRILTELLLQLPESLAALDEGGPWSFHLSSASFLVPKLITIASNIETFVKQMKNLREPFKVEDDWKYVQELHFFRTLEALATGAVPLPLLQRVMLEKGSLISWNSCAIWPELRERCTTVLEPGESMMACGRCKAVRYCCKDHQRRCWKKHEQTCLPSQGELSFWEGGDGQLLDATEELTPSFLP